MKLKFFTCIFFLIVAQSQMIAQSNLFLDTSYTAEQMVNDFFGNSCVTPSNVTFTGGYPAMSYFEAANTDIDINAGIFLSSGSVFNAIGPNDQAGISTSFNALGDVDLDALVGVPTYDAAVLEMDIIPETDTICFYYIFGSEEYEEFVGTSFNDVFAFFIDGPGYNGPTNIALVPGDVIPVSINNVNQNMNTSYYQNNDGGVHTQYDGLTLKLPAKAIVTPFETYHVKIAVGDAADQIYDSGVFLGIESLCGDSLLTPPADFIVVQSGDTIEVLNNSRYATSYLWDFGDNTTSNLRHPAPHIYQEPGEYQLTLITNNWCCSDTFQTTVEIEETVNTKLLNEEAFNIFPNPVKDNLTIAIDQWATVNLFDLQGKLLVSQVGSENINFQMTNLSNGIYFLEIIIDDTAFIKKVIKE